MPNIGFVEVGPLAVGETQTFSFPVSVDPPDFVLPLTATPIAVFGTPTRTAFTFKNLGSAVETATFYLMFYSSAELTTEENFVPLCWQGR